MGDHRGTGYEPFDVVPLTQEADAENSIPQAEGLKLVVLAVDSSGAVLSASIRSYGQNGYATGQVCTQVGSSVRMGATDGGTGLRVRVVSDKMIPLSFFIKVALINQKRPRNADDTLIMMDLENNQDNQEVYGFYTQLRDLNYEKNKRKTIPALYCPVDPNARAVKETKETQEYWMSYPPCALEFLTYHWAKKTQRPRSWRDKRRRREWTHLSFPDEMLNGVENWPKNTPIRYELEFFEILKITETDTDPEHNKKKPGELRDTEEMILFEFRTTVPDDTTLKYRAAHENPRKELDVLDYQLYLSIKTDGTNREPVCNRIWEDGTKNQVDFGNEPVYIPVLRKYCHFTTSQYIRTFADTNRIEFSKPYVVTTPLHPSHFPISRMALSGNYGGQFKMVRNKTRSMINISQEKAASSDDYRKLISSVSYNKKDRECDFTFLCTPSDLLGSTQEIFDLDQYEVTTDGGVLNAGGASIIEITDEKDEVIAVLEKSWGTYSVLDIRDNLQLGTKYVVNGTTYSINLPAGATPKQVGSRTHLILNSTLRPVVTTNSDGYNRTSQGNANYAPGDTVTQELGVILGNGDPRMMTFEITRMGGIDANVVTGVRLQGAPRFHNFPGWTNAGSPFITVPLGEKQGLEINFAALNRGQNYQVGDEFEIQADYDGDSAPTRPAVGVVMQVGDTGEVLDAVLRDEGDGYGRTLMVRRTTFMGDTTGRANAPDNKLKVRLSIGIQSGNMDVSGNAIPPHQNAACVWERLERMGLNLERDVIVDVTRILVRALDIGKAKMGPSSAPLTVPTLEPVVPFVVSSGGPNNFATSTMPLDLLFQRYLGKKKFSDLRNAQ